MQAPCPSTRNAILPAGGRAIVPGAAPARNLPSRRGAALVSSMVLSLIAFAWSLAGPQEPAAPSTLPAGVVARLGERTITREEYLDYLWLRIGKRGVHDMVTDLLVENEARRYGLAADEAAVQKLVAEREQAARQSPRQLDFEEDLRRAGQSIEMWRAMVAQEVRRDLLLGELVRATRVVTDQRLRQEFETRHGPGGVKLTLRHILLMPNVLKAEAIRAGQDPNSLKVEEMRASARQLAENALARVRGGEDFAAVAQEVSHDAATKAKGGELPPYDGRLYGPAFRDAVMALRPGAIGGVVETPAGFHVIQLVERTETRLEDVREQLVAEVLASEPTWQEKQGLLQALQSTADLQLW